MSVLKSIVDELGANSAAIMAPNDVEQHMYCYDSYNMPSEWVAIKNSYDNYTSVGNVHVYKTHWPVINNGYANVFHGHYIESVLIVPITQNGKVIATLELIHSQKGKTFGQNDLEKAIQFAEQLKIK